MDTSRKPETVKVGGLSCKIWQCSSGEYRWHYHQSGKRRTGSAMCLAKAKARAKAALELLRDGRSELTSSTATDYADFLKWQAQRQKSPDLSKAVIEYLTTVKASGVTDIYLNKCRQDLEKFTASHNGTVADVTTNEIEDWLTSRKVGPRRSNNLLATLVSLFRWCRARKYVADETTAPERVARKKTKSGTVQVFTPADLEKILAVSGDWKPSVAIQAFAGIRTAEVGRLYWRNIMLGKRLIDVPPDAAKVGKRRLVPISDNLATFLQGHHDPDDMVCPYEGHQVFIERIIRQKKAKWVKNGLRHAFGSFRCAILKDVAAVAYEMGNSPAMVMRHYHEAQEVGDALKWFGIECPSPNESNGKVTGEIAA